MFSGATAALVCNPIELVKTQQQGQVEKGGPLRGLGRIYAADGIRGLWRGTQVLMARSAAVTGPHLTTCAACTRTPRATCLSAPALRYSLSKERAIAAGWQDSTMLHVLCSLLGGLSGIICNHPLDTVRNRCGAR